MPLHWQPVGPLPAATYWRRRALVLAAAVAVLYVAAIPLLHGGDDVLTGEQPAPTAGPTADPAAGATAGPSAAPDGDDSDGDDSDGDAQPCPDDVLEVAATADQSRYPPGATARLELSVRNTGSEPCRRAVGQGAVELVVTSGQDRIWSSDDCAPGGPEGEVVLQPGAVETARAAWPLVRSAPECPPDQPEAAPGTYRVTARVGELRAPGDVFTVTD